jgi:hypothetical protein
MNRIAPYENWLNENQSGLMGMVIHLSAYGDESFFDTYNMCVVRDFWSAARYVIEEDMGDMEPDEIESAIDSMLSPGDLETVFENYISESWNSYDSVNVSIWTGLTPRSQTETHESIYSPNPYRVTSEIDKVFSNAREIMLKNDAGAAFFTDVIVQSIKANPAKIANYYKDNPKKAEELAAKAGIPEDKLRSFIKYSEIKKQI